MIRAFPLLAALLLFSLPHSAGAPAAASGEEPDIVLKKGAADLSRADEGTLGTHRVREGETISGILTSAGVPLSKIEELLKLNPGLPDPDTIYPGQELILPSAADFPAEPSALTPQERSPPRIRGLSSVRSLLSWAWTPGSSSSTASLKAMIRAFFSR